MRHCQGRHGIKTKNTPSFLQSSTSGDGLVNEPENITEIPTGEGKEPYESEELEPRVKNGFKLEQKRFWKSVPSHLADVPNKF